MALEIEPAGLHEGERLGDAVGDRLVAVERARVLYKTEHPLMHAAEARVAAMREGAQQVQRRGRLVIGLDQPRRIGRARVPGELRAVDDVAAVARQLDIVAPLDRRRARLGELTGDPPDLHHRRGSREGQHHRHLQEDAEEVADRVRAVVLEALGAVAALEQESLPGRDARERFLQVARLAGKDERRKARKPALDRGELRRIGIFGDLNDRLRPPAFRRPALCHDAILHQLDSDGRWSRPRAALIHEGACCRKCLISFK